MTYRKSIISYGVAMAVLIVILKYVEYQFHLRDLSLEVYLGVVALFFIILGAWIGRRLTRVRVVTAGPDFEPNEANLEKLGITKREHEVLQLIAAGMSNQEIADKLFISTSTIKTHASSLFVKLEASRRTQAIQRAKELGVLP